MSKPTSQTMTRTQIYIEPDTLLQAKIAAKKVNFNLSQYLRNLIKIDLEKKITTNIHPKDIKSFSIPGLKPGEKVTYSTDHNDIYDY